MNIGTLQSQLDSLGVSLVFDDDTSLPGYTRQLQTQLKIERQYRAALYVHHLHATQTFLTKTLADPPGRGLGSAAYPFVKPALAQGSLLNDLAGSLDEWICSAVNQEMAATGATTYEGWFDTDVFAGTHTYKDNVTAFFNKYPLTRIALDRIAENFQRNLKKACQRIIDDRKAITELFSDKYPRLTLDALREISSTGSDFHKGGQQVLILTFDTRSFSGFALKTSTLKLVYKPADVEIDCLIMGDSAAVNRARASPDFPPFMERSLVEIFNAEVRASRVAGLEELPSYRILPRTTTSGRGAPAGLVQDAYGYIEHLGYALTGMGWHFFNYYPLGASDYLIFPGQAKDPIVNKFYRQCGQLLALAVTFSLTDLHCENVRVTGYQPHLIDLEACLTRPCNVAGTLLLDPENGGFKVERLQGHKRLWGVASGSPPHIGLCYPIKLFQNRLWEQHPNREAVPIHPALLAGLKNGMNTLRAIQRDRGFKAWFKRCDNVLVRVLPVGTQTWKEARQEVYAPDGPRPAVLDSRVNTVMRNKLTDVFAEYRRDRTTDPDVDPYFVAMTAPQAATDIKNFDIPVFYHRIGSMDLLDSMGEVVSVPFQVTVNNNQPPPPTVQQSTNPRRLIYFAASPACVKQVEALDDTNKFEARVEALMEEVTTMTGLTLPKDNKNTPMVSNKRGALA
ncbi:DUF4135 domain-containing protein [Streptomyces sp. NPDC021749]|uniref:DUF4135 domain-containing protein n=1 Tax=Streptomyces sp. NPDC021749 TaxID=3154905 RepID=UPI003403B30E